MPSARIILSRSLPAFPTKGRPVRSSSNPGPSPTNTNRAAGEPSPKTMCERWPCRRHRLQSPICSLVSRRASSAFSTDDPGTGSACAAACSVRVPRGRAARPADCRPRSIRRSRDRVSASSAPGPSGAFMFRSFPYEPLDPIQHEFGNRFLRKAGQFRDTALSVYDFDLVGVAAES